MPDMKIRENDIDFYFYFFFKSWLSGQAHFKIKIKWRTQCIVSVR